MGPRHQPSPRERGKEEEKHTGDLTLWGWAFFRLGRAASPARLRQWPCPALRCSPGRAPRGGGVGCRRFSAGRGGAGLEDASCGEGGAAGASLPAWADAATPLHHQPPPLARTLFLPHPAASLPGLDSSAASPLRLLPGVLGPFRRVIGQRAGGSSAPFGWPALAPAPRAALRRFPRARDRPPPERAWPPIKEAGRARRRHYPLRSEQGGTEAAEPRRFLQHPRPDAPTAPTPRSR